MAGTARLHHYIPQAYLSGFAVERKANEWQTQVKDFVAGKAYPSSTRNICAERDFMRVDVEGERIDVVESEMGKFEGQCVGGLRRVVAARKFEGEDANLTLNLMALLAVRSPERREHLRRIHEQIAKQVMGVVLSNRETWDAQIAGMQANGGPDASNVTYEDMKAFIDGDQYTVTVPRERQMKTEFELMEPVLHELGRRAWTLYYTDGSVGEFITSNRPVVLSYSNPEVAAKARFGPGFSTPDTDVVFPLTKHALLLGHWGQEGRSEEADQRLIAALNTHTAAHSDGRVFSHSAEFPYHTPDMQMHFDASIADRLRQTL